MADFNLPSPGQPNWGPKITGSMQYLYDKMPMVVPATQDTSAIPAGTVVFREGGVELVPGTAFASGDFSYTLRADTSANWNDLNPVLRKGEPSLSVDTGDIKIGNGTDTWRNLPTNLSNKSLEKQYYKFGASPSSTDNTALFQGLLNNLGAQSGGKLLLPAGFYRFSSALTVPERVAIQGMGPGTRIEFTGTGKFLTFKNESKLIEVDINGTSDDYTLVYLNNVFRVELRSVTLSGHHLSTGAKPSQIGIEIRGNAGDSQFNNCRFNNLGSGIRTDSIMDYVMGCVFSACQRGIWGDGNNYGSGISVSDTTFVSNAASTIAHIQVDGNANKWWFTNTWMEGATDGVVIGSTAGGPYSFGMVNCAVASTTRCIVVNNARQTYLANVSLEQDGGATPVPLTINSAGFAADGVVTNVPIYTGFDLDASIFPKNWTYVGRDKLKVPGQIIGDADWSGAINVQSSNKTKPIFKANGPVDINANIFELGKGGTVFTRLDQYNNLFHTGSFYVGGASALNWDGGSAMYNGSGVPTIAGRAGDFYLRKDTPSVANQRIYVCTVTGAAGAATWLGIG